MNRKDLQTKYHIIGNNNDIALYCKKSEDRAFSYVGNVALSNGKAKFNGKSYTDLDELGSAVEEWGKSLEWPVDTYNPMLSDAWRLSSRLLWYLEEKMGFERDYKDWGSIGIRLKRNIGPGFSLFFEISDRDGKVDIYSKFAGISFMQPVSDANEGVAVISSIINGTVLSMAGDMVNVLSVCPKADVPEIRTFVDSNRDIFGFEEVDFKDVMINLLETQLKKLKGE